MPRTAPDLGGRRFGRWVATSRRELRGKGKYYWLCRCDCGTERYVWGPDLISGRSTNCGCVRRRKVAARNHKHGLTSTREYVVWCGMIARCENPGHKGYVRYGGRGIKVCRRWRRSFTAFLADMGLPPTRRHQIDRIDNDGDYRPGNCRWRLNKENANNKRNNRHIEYAGERLTLQQWAERTGISRFNIANRLNSGWSAHDALTTPILSHCEAAKRAGQRRRA